MAKRSYRPDEIINKLREVEVLFSQGSTVGEASRKIGVAERRIAAGEENTRGKKLVADLSLDNALPQGER